MDGQKGPGVLTIATTLIAILSEILVASIEPMAKTLGMTQIFVGVILVALVGNAAEHSIAVVVALKNKMDLAFGIARWGRACKLRCWWRPSWSL